MTQLDPRVPKLEALLDRILTRAAEPRAVAVAPVAAAPVPAPAPAVKPPPPMAPEPASVLRPAPQTLAGPPSRRSHGALPAFTPPPRAPGSQPALPAAEIDHKTPVPPGSATPANLQSDPIVSAIRIDVDPSVDALLASDADYDDATIQANVERPSNTLAGVGNLPRTPLTPVPEAPASAPRAIEAAFEDEDDRRHTPPPESGKQKSPSLTPVAARSGELPRLTEDDPNSREDGTLVGVGGGLGAVAARVTGSVVAETSLEPAVTGPSVFTANLPRTTVTATVEGKAVATEPRTFGDLIDAALSL